AVAAPPASAAPAPAEPAPVAPAPVAPPAPVIAAVPAPDVPGNRDVATLPGWAQQHVSELSTAHATAEARARSAEGMLAAVPLAHTHGIVGPALASLMDSASFQRAVGGLDVTAADYGAQLDTVIKNAVAANPLLTATPPAAAPQPAPSPRGSAIVPGSPTIPAGPTDLRGAIAAAYNGASR
ncbi:hypothetical protein AB1484_26885, partial [Parafrankia sp. FMc6]